jgi:hypothetical protein
MEKEKKKGKEGKYEIFISSSEGVPLMLLHADSLRESEERSADFIERGFKVTLSRKKLKELKDVI